MKRLPILLLLALAGAGCSRVHEKKLTPSRDVPPAARVAPAASPALPDYAARAKAEIGREQRQELQVRAGQLRIELPLATRQ